MPKVILGTLGHWSSTTMVGTFLTRVAVATIFTEPDTDTVSQCILIKKQQPQPVYGHYTDQPVLSGNPY